MCRVFSGAGKVNSLTTLTSNVDEPEEPNKRNTVGWVARNVSEAAAYGESNTFHYDSPILARHVAVYSESNGPLYLAEMVVYGTHFPLYSCI